MFFIAEVCDLLIKKRWNLVLQSWRVSMFFEEKEARSIASRSNSLTIFWDRDMRPISLKPVRPEGMQYEQNFPEKWPVAELTNK